MNVIDLEKPVRRNRFAGRTDRNQSCVELLTDRGVNIIGTDCRAIDNAEEPRPHLKSCLKSLNIPKPEGKAVTNIEDGVRAAAEIGYPVLVRPSFVLGGRAMQIVSDERSASQISEKRR